MDTESDKKQGSGQFILYGVKQMVALATILTDT